MVSKMVMNKVQRGRGIVAERIDVKKWI